jgi:hypothetical protein
MCEQADGASGPRRRVVSVRRHSAWKRLHPRRKRSGNGRQPIIERIFEYVRRGRPLTGLIQLVLSALMRSWFKSLVTQLSYMAAFRVEYSDDDPNSQLREAPIPKEEFARLPEDGAAGFGFIEARLTRLLA